MNTIFVAAAATAAFALAGSAFSQPVDTAPPAASPLPPDNAQPAPLTPAQPEGPNIDWPYARLMADPASKAVLTRDVPNITGYEYQDQIQTLTLRQIAHFPQAGIDAAKLDAIQADLTSGAAPPPVPPVVCGARPAATSPAPAQSPACGG